MAKYALRAFGAPVWYSDDGCPFVLIGGQAYSSQAGSLSIDSAIGRRSTASLTVRTDAPTYFPEDSQISIYDGNTTLIFSGYLTAPQYGKPGFQKVLYHQLTACDKHRLADKRRVSASFVGFTGAYIARWLVDNILVQEGIAIGNIYDGSTCSDTLICSDTLLCSEAVGVIDSIAFDYCTVSEAYDAVVKGISSSGVPYYWQINYNSTLDLVPYDAIINSTVIDGSLIDQVYNPPIVTRANPVYRNTQIIKGGTAETVLQNETRIGDGNTQSWPMRYAISQVPTITVNSIAKTVGIRGIDTGKNFYWSKGQFEITQDSAGTKLTSSDTLAVAYIGLYNNVAIVADSAQIALEASIDGSSGIVEEVEDLPLTSLSSQLDVAGARLTRYAVQSPPAFEFSTLQTGFVQGQFMPVNIPDLSLNVQMLIESVNASDSADGFNIWYRIKAISGPSDTTWQAFWGEITKTDQNSQSSATTTITTISQSFSLGISIAVSFAPVVNACPIVGNSTLCGNSLFVC